MNAKRKTTDRSLVSFLGARERARTQPSRTTTSTPAPLHQAVLAGAGDYAIAAAMLLAWVSPQWLWRGAIAHFELVMFFEFFVIIWFGAASLIAGSQAPLPRKVVGISLVILPFAGLLWGTVAELGQLWPVLVVAGLFANKLHAFHGLSPGGANALQLENVIIVSAMAAIYLVAVGAGGSIEWPALGVTSDAVGRRFVTGGEWQRRPQTPLAAGVIYFAAVGAVESFLARRKGPR